MVSTQPAYDYIANALCDVRGNVILLVAKACDVFCHVGDKRVYVQYGEAFPI